MEEDAAGGIDNVVTEFNNYEDFLDSQITPLDLYYLEVRMFISCICCIFRFTHLKLAPSFQKFVMYSDHAQHKFRDVL